MRMFRQTSAGVSAQPPAVESASPSNHRFMRGTSRARGNGIPVVGPSSAMQRFGGHVEIRGIDDHFAVDQYQGALRAPGDIEVVRDHDDGKAFLRVELLDA